MAKVIAFDIGIKNLAYCILENTHIHRLENCNILEPVTKTSCTLCKCDASFMANSIPYCKRHIPKTYKIVNTHPNLGELKELAKLQGIDIKKKLKNDIILALSSTHAFRFIQPKQPKASSQSLESLHDALHKFVHDRWASFSTCTEVLLENQPAFKNPHMKSVQVLLFTTLRERFIADGVVPPFHLVHAKKKVKDVEAGDAGYAERKSKSEQRVYDLFEKNTVGPETVFEEWNKAKKKSDMADAICMCYDFLSNKD